LKPIRRRRIIIFKNGSNISHRDLKRNSFMPLYKR